MRALAAPLVALVVGLPRAAPAQAPAAPEPGWSLGAGVVFFETFRTAALYPAAPISAFAPGVAASLERRLGASTWLVLGAAASWYSARQDIPQGSTGLSRDEEREIAARGGVRFALTGPGSPVEVSALALVGVGYARRSATLVSRSPTGTSSLAQEARAISAGADLGLALERELVPRLALRIETPLVGLSYGETTMGDRSDGRLLWAGLRLAPSLGLRLAF